MSPELVTALRHLREAVEFQDACSREPDDGRGTDRDAREWVDTAAREVVKHTPVHK